MNKISFEDMQNIIKNDNALIINTLNNDNQKCLIKNTISDTSEVDIINSKTKSTQIVIYGSNCNCEKIYEKYSQLVNFGFTNVYIYVGGMFEWLCLQDIFGYEEFPTTSRELDILKYKAKSM